VGLIGKFQDFRKSRDDKRIAKLSAVVKNSKAIKEDRWNAIQFFKEHKDIEVAIANMLPRFEYSLEHGIQDTREKEACMDAITQFGADALTFIEDHLIKTTRIAWPIKILKALGKDSEVVDTLKKALDFGDVRFEQQKVDKNYDILCYLVDYKLPEFAEKLVHFLNDPDERVRYACCEVLIEQEGDFVPEIL
jgi:HEAT repeat protein